MHPKFTSYSIIENISLGVGVGYCKYNLHQGWPHFLFDMHQNMSFKAWQAKFNLIKTHN